MSQSSQSKFDVRGPGVALALVVGFAGVTMRSEPADGTGWLPWTLNPTGLLDMNVYILAYVLSVPGRLLLDHILTVVLQGFLQTPRMDASSKKGQLEVLEWIDLSYLTFNTFGEFIGMNHIFAMLLSHERPLGALGVVNGPVAFVALMILNDLIYYPFHYVAHFRSLYPYCHKQHHRNFMPFRGYGDAGNQNPFEQFYGFLIFMLCQRLVGATLGLHAAAAWTAFLAWATFNLMNHLAYDGQLHLPLPYPAYPHDHQMHHRIPTCNYSTLTTMFDRLFGSFRPYQPIGGTSPAQSKSQEAVPSPWSVVGLGVALTIAALLVDSCHTLSFPSAGELSQMALVLSALVPATLFCAVVQCITAPVKAC